MRRCARRGNHWTHRLGAISNRASDTTLAGCGCILTRAPRNQHAISTPAPTPWETTLSLAPASSRRGRPRGGSCSPTSWRMSSRTLPQGGQTLFDEPRTRPLSLRRKLFRPFGTWKVGLSSLLSSTDGERLFMNAVATRLDRKAMPVRRRAIGRPSMDGSRARKLKAQGISLRKTITGISSPTDPLHGYGNEKNKQVAKWLGEQKLERPATEQPWEEVQAGLKLAMTMHLIFSRTRISRSKCWVR